MSVDEHVKAEEDYDSDVSELAATPFRPLSPDGPPIKRRRLSPFVLPTPSVPAASETHVKEELPALPFAIEDAEEELDYPSPSSDSSESGPGDDDEIDEPDTTDPADYVPSTVGLAPRAHPRDRADDRYIMRYTTIHPPKALRMARIREESDLFRKSRARISKVRCLAVPRPKKADGSVGYHQAKKWAKMRKRGGKNKTWIEADLCRMWMMLAALLQVAWPSTPEANVLDSVRVHFALKRQSWTMVERMVSRVVWKFGGQVYTSEKHFLAGPRGVTRYRLQGTLQPVDVSLEVGGRSGVTQMSYFHLAQITDSRRGWDQTFDIVARDIIRVARRPIANIGFMLEQEWEAHVQADLADRKRLYQWVRLRLFVEAYEWIQRTVPATLSNLMVGCEVRWTPLEIPASVNSGLIDRALALIAYCGGAHKAVKRQPDEEEWMSRGDRSEPIDLAEPVTTKSTATVIFGDPEADTAETLLRAMARLDAKCPYTK